MPLIQLLKSFWVCYYTSQEKYENTHIHFKASSHYIKNTWKWHYEYANNEMRKVSLVALMILGSEHFILHVDILI